MTRKTNSLVVGLDIGTSKILMVVAEITREGEIDVLGIGHQPASGLRKGVVADIESTVHSIKGAVEDATIMSDCQIYSVYAGIAGAHIGSINSHGVVAIKDNEVTEGDVERVIDAAKAMSIPNGQQILHVLPREFVIDGQDGIRKPIGMCGVRMEVRVHIITGAISAVQNIVKCVRRCGLEVDDIILEPVASGEAVLTEDEKELGVCMVDIGGGTTDIAIFHEGTISYTVVIPIAGNQVTNDIAVAFHTSTQDADEIKMKYGCALAQLVEEDQTIEIPGMGGRPSRTLSRRSLADVIEPRIEELLLLIQAEIRKSGYESVIGSGIVITGGTSRLEGMVELAEEIFHLPVRRGLSGYGGKHHEVIRNPIYSTAMGLVQFGYSNQSGGGQEAPETNAVASMVGRMKRWVKESF